MTLINREPEACVADNDRAALRRNKIVSTARRLFSENGFHATGVAQIATESGVAVGQIYRDFSSKEAIVAYIAKSDCVEFLAHDSLRRGIEIGDTETVWNWLREFFSHGSDDDGVLITEIMAESTRNPKIAAIFDKNRGEVRETILAAIEVLAPGELLAQRRSQLADLILALSMGLLQHRLLVKNQSHDSLVESTLRIIRMEIAVMRGEVPNECNFLGQTFLG